MQVLFDVYHLHDTDNVLADTVKYGSRISPSVHICDWREETRNDFDRVLPGDGIIDLPGIFGALDAARASALGRPRDLLRRRLVHRARLRGLALEAGAGRRARAGQGGLRRGVGGPEAARLMRLAGKVALVTGAARRRGIGRGMVQALADEGAAVAVNDIAAAEAEGQEFVDELQGKGVRAGLYVADVSVRSEVDALISRRAGRSRRARHRLLERGRRRLEDGRRDGRGDVRPHRRASI